MPTDIKKMLIKMPSMGTYFFLLNEMASVPGFTLHTPRGDVQSGIQGCWVSSATGNAVTLSDLQRDFDSDTNVLACEIPEVVKSWDYCAKKGYNVQFVVKSGLNVTPYWNGGDLAKKNGFVWYIRPYLESGSRQYIIQPMTGGQSNLPEMTEILKWTIIYLTSAKGDATDICVVRHRNSNEVYYQGSFEGCFNWLVDNFTKEDNPPREDSKAFLSLEEFRQKVAEDGRKS